MFHVRPWSCKVNEGCCWQTKLHVCILFPPLSKLERESKIKLTLVLLNPDIPCFANSVDPDQLASEEAN